MSAALAVRWIAQKYGKPTYYYVPHPWSRIVGMFIWKEIPSAECEYIWLKQTKIKIIATLYWKISVLKRNRYPSFDLDIERAVGQTRVLLFLL